MHIEEQSKKRNLKDQHGYAGTPEQSLWNRTMAIYAESVSASAFGIPYAPKEGTFKTLGDLGEDEIRWTPSDTNVLIIRPDDDVESRRFWLVTGEGTILTLHGWRWGYQAKYLVEKSNFGNPNRPLAWGIPQHLLYRSIPADAGKPNQHNHEHTNPIPIKKCML